MGSRARLQPTCSSLGRLPPWSAHKSWAVWSNRHTLFDFNYEQNLEMYINSMHILLVNISTVSVLFNYELGRMHGECVHWTEKRAERRGRCIEWDLHVVCLFLFSFTKKMCVCLLFIYGCLSSFTCNLHVLVVNENNCRKCNTATLLHKFVTYLCVGWYFKDLLTKLEC